MIETFLVILIIINSSILLLLARRECDDKKKRKSNVKLFRMFDKMATGMEKVSIGAGVWVAGVAVWFLFIFLALYFLIVSFITM